MRAPSTPCAAKHRGGVLWLDAAAVLYGKRLSRFLLENLTEAPPNEGMRVLSLLGGGFVSATADCPDRFVRDGHAGQGVRRHID